MDRVDSTHSLAIQTFLCTDSNNALHHLFSLYVHSTVSASPLQRLSAPSQFSFRFPHVAASPSPQHCLFHLRWLGASFAKSHHHPRCLYEAAQRLGSSQHLGSSQVGLVGHTLYAETEIVLKHCLLMKFTTSAMPLSNRHSQQHPTPRASGR